MTKFLLICWMVTFVVNIGRATNKDEDGPTWSELLIDEFMIILLLFNDLVVGV
jgi:hypothetical protein